MYTIFCDGECIFDPMSPDVAYKVTNPSLSLSDSAAGSLTMTIPPTNARYDYIQRLASEIVVYNDGEEIWSGRVLEENTDFWKNRVLKCEGELAYFNDTTQPPAEFHNITVRDFLTTLVNEHNKKASADKQFTVGDVSVQDEDNNIYRYTNYETTLECINEKLVKRLGGHLRIRKENGVRYLDYLADYPNVNTQKIEFGKNLLDYTSSYDISNLATVVLPRGCELEESPIAALTAYLTVESVNDGSPYVVSQIAVDTYGWIEVVEDWSNVTKPENLLKKAQTYLSDIQFEKMELELSVIDLHNLNPAIEQIKLLDSIHCISEPHGMDRYFPVTKMKIYLDKPESSTYTLGSSEKLSLTQTNQKNNEFVKEKVANLPTESQILERAKREASDLITAATTGFVSLIEKDGVVTEIIIADQEDYKEAEKVWRWNANGFGFSANGYEGPYSTAITMDGAIVADYITTGLLSLGGKNGTFIKVYDETGNVIGSWTKGGLTVNKGEINLSGTGVVDGDGTIYSRRLIIDSSRMTVHDDSSGGYLNVGGTSLYARSGVSSDDTYTDAFYSNGSMSVNKIKQESNEVVSFSMILPDHIQSGGSIHAEGTIGGNAINGKQIYSSGDIYANEGQIQGKTLYASSSITSADRIYATNDSGGSRPCVTGNYATILYWDVYNWRINVYFGEGSGSTGTYAGYIPVTR